jgi:hypothetical protein
LKEGPIRCEQGLIVTFPLGKQRITYARLPLRRSAQRIDTAHGAFIVEALDDTIAKPGGPKQRQGLTIEVEGDAVERRIRVFELRALLRQANVHFRSSTKEGSGGKPDSTKSPADEPLFHRFDFTGSECLFQLAPLVPAGPTQADGSVILGQAGGFRDGDRAPVQLDLTQATFRVVRPSDLLSLKFRFVGLQLDARGSKAFLKRLGAGSCSAFKYRSANASDDIVIDNRPMLVVEFPPQHIAERAYFRQLNEGENAPDVVLDDVVRKKLAKEFALLDRFACGIPCGLSDRVSARKKIRKAKIDAARLTCLGDDAAARKRAERFQQVTEELEWAYPTNPKTWSWTEDQAVYIGPEWLDMDVRTYVREFLLGLANAEYSLLPVASRLPQADCRDGDFALWLDAYERLEHVPPQLNQGDSRGAKDGRVYRH